MTSSLARPPPKLAAPPSALLALAVAALVLAALAISLPADHDEGQYVAAAALARRLVPYRDFAYLQTPLQLYLTAPITALTQGWAFLALRLANAAMALGELALIYAAQRRLGVERGRALAAAGLLLLAYPFEFSSVVARNDALPALLETGAMLAGLEALRRDRSGWPLWTLAGLLLGAAASTKLSYVFPPAALGLWLLWRVWRSRTGLASLAGFAAGGLLGLLPCLIAWLQAPEGFVWGAITYAETAPRAWYGWLGQGDRLSLSRRVLEGAFHLGVGPALAVFVGVILAAAQRRTGPPASSVTLLQVLALSGVAAALAPSPMQRQYLCVLLPPLIVLWGVQDPWSRLEGAGRLAVRVLLVAGVVIGVGRVGYVLGDAVSRRRPPPALALTAETHWLGRTLTAMQLIGPVATLSPRVVLDSGLALDRRFASGVFAYRTGDLVPDDQQRRLHILSPRTLRSGLDAEPPAAIVTGFETPAGFHRRNPDDDLRAYARARGWPRLTSPDGAAEVWLRPR